MGWSWHQNELQSRAISSALGSSAQEEQQRKPVAPGQTGCISDSMPSACDCLLHLCAFVAGLNMPISDFKLTCESSCLRLWVFTASINCLDTPVLAYISQVVSWQFLGVHFTKCICMHAVLLIKQVAAGLYCGTATRSAGL